MDRFKYYDILIEISPLGDLRTLAGSPMQRGCFPMGRWARFGLGISCSLSCLCLRPHRLRTSSHSFHRVPDRLGGVVVLSSLEEDNMPL
jgi:hypothetical protein